MQVNALGQLPSTALLGGCSALCRHVIADPLISLRAGHFGSRESTPNLLRCQASAPARQQEQGQQQQGRPRQNRGGGRGGRGGRGRQQAAGGKRRMYKASDGKNHLGSALQYQGEPRPFPGPPSGEGPPLRVLPIGGLGEIGMNCMLIGVNDRYILVDAGLMFPDFQDLGMAKILPDVSFLAQWKDKIEAVIVTHGHEDHIGAFPWVFPALDPSTKVFAPGFAMQLIRRRLQEFSLWDESRFHTFKMKDRFQLGPFDCEPIRVTHSIPDCCGMVLRSEHGNIVHTGDWKIEENPVDGDYFDREYFEALGREGIALMMSDSTNVLSPGRTNGEDVVRKAMIDRVLGHAGKGRVITTQFASNLHRLSSVKQAADASGRKLCFLGMSLTTYLEAADLEGRAPFDPKELISPADIDTIEPSKLMIVSTGSQGEPRAALSLASYNASPLLRLHPSDLLLYSARVIPGNDVNVTKLMNRISALGPEIALGRQENLHCSGHAYKDELEELIRLVKPQHFLPVHGEYAFLCAHAQLARENGINHTSVIRNGQMLGVTQLRNKNSVGGVQGVAGMKNLGEVALNLFYNDGNKGTGTRAEMKIDERSKLATDGLVVAAVEVDRRPPPRQSRGGEDSGQPDALARMRGQVKLTSRALWLDGGRLIPKLHAVATQAIQRLPNDAQLAAVEKIVGESIRREVQAFNRKAPEVIVIANEANPALAAQVLKGRTTRSGKAVPVPAGMMEQRARANPRENPGSGGEATEYG